MKKIIVVINFCNQVFLLKNYVINRTKDFKSGNYKYYITGEIYHNDLNEHLDFIEILEKKNYILREVIQKYEYSSVNVYYRNNLEKRKIDLAFYFCNSIMREVKRDDYLLCLFILNKGEKKYKKFPSRFELMEIEE